ncbi:MAG TPA: hypothetical protein PLW01_04885 [Agitococcus sp.]|nr:hypothetical protein [Agitococcus sp.]
MIWVFAIGTVYAARIVDKKAPIQSTPTVDDFTCGGSIESATWKLWEQRGLPFLRERLIGVRLQEQGDTYALYDMQTYFDSLVALAQRCQRFERMQQMADALMPLFERLEALPSNSTQRAWICRGGAICNTRNRLINTEVMLVSVQGLGLLSHLAQVMAANKRDSVRSHPFVAATGQTAAQHLMRWGDVAKRTYWQRLTQASPSDVKDSNSSELFFTDHTLWMIDIYANLAGIYVHRPDLAQALLKGQQRAMADAMRDALQFFKARTTWKPQSRMNGVQGAEVDAGYWRLYVDFRYAGYSGEEPPAVCIKQADGGYQALLKVDARAVPVVTDLGWDISHARRLVHVLLALDQNRDAIKKIYALDDHDLVMPNLTKAFAAQLLGKVWNGDKQHPLFANYWNGTNGWYRVAYDNGTGQCHEGYPPFGLTNSFTTGGYATWGRYYVAIKELGQSLYNIALSKSDKDQTFVRQYYRDLLDPYSQLMFWPTLIGIDN